MTSGRLIVGDVPGLKSVARATAAPASINLRAGACSRLPRKIIVAGSRTATVSLAAGDTRAGLVPATMIFLGKREQAPARRLIDAGAAVALATDFNPGTSPTMSLPLVMALGVSQLGLRHAEVLTAVTVNAAAALGLAGERGQLAQGFAADLVVAAVEDWREAAYWMGANVVSAV